MLNYLSIGWKFYYGFGEKRLIIEDINTPLLQINCTSSESASIFALIL